MEEGCLMEFDLEKQTLTIYGKTERLSVLANRLQALSGKQTYEFLSSRSVFLPRKINVLALRSVLNERLKSLHASELPKDYYAILENYRNFSEYQLFNLFATICDNKDDFKAYRLNLWKLILINYEALNLTDGEINYLKNISKLQTERLEKYFQYITSSAREMENTFDGLEKDALKLGLFASATEEDVVDIASKYGIELPLEYDLDSFRVALKEYLAAFNKLTMELDSYIDKAGDMTLENFAIKNKIPLSFKMDRDKLINYLFFILSIAEMNVTDVKELIEPESYKPLQFSVNLDGAFDGDEPLDNVRVIVYDGCENDGLFVPIEPEEVYEEVEEVQEDIYEEEEVEALNLEEDKPLKAVAPKEEKEESSPLDVLKDDSLNDGQSNASLLARAKAGFAAQNRKERKELSFGDIEENPYYGNPKTKNLYRGPARMIALVILILVLAGLGVGVALKYAGII
jgi:hypothetical protein